MRRILHLAACTLGLVSIWGRPILAAGTAPPSQPPAPAPAPTPQPTPSPVTAPLAPATDVGGVNDNPATEPVAAANKIPVVPVKQGDNFVYSQILFPNQSITLKLLDASNNPVPNVRWQSKDRDIASATSDGLVYGVSTGNATISAYAGSDTTTPLASVLIVVSSVAGFRPVTVQLNIMDDKTAGDLFGDVTAHNFIVARIRVFNDLDKSTDLSVQGKSILAFSESISTNVVLEKEFDSNLKTSDRGVPTKGWTVVTEADMHEQFPSDSNYNSTNPTQPHVFAYRPYVYELMLNSVDARYQQEGRYKVRRTLQAFGLAGSFLSTLRAIKGSSSLVFDAFNGVLLGNYDTILPSLNQSQRQNLVTQAMQPIEQIAFGSDIAKVIFFPKTEFNGLVRGYRTRISTIDTNSLQINVSVLSDVSTAKVKSDVQAVPAP